MNSIAKTLFRLFAAFVLFFAFVSEMRANVTLPSVFSDHAVLLGDRNVPVWGTATPGEIVCVKLGKVEEKTTAGIDGKWKVSLDLSQESSGPFELVVEGGNKLVFSDVLVGETWLCSGQSNMKFRLIDAENGNTERANANEPQIRLFTVGDNVANEPQSDVKGHWVVCSPQSVRFFSAVAYLFGKELHQSLGKPVGLICAAWNGSLIEAWTSHETLLSDPDFKPILDRFAKQLDDYPAAKAEFDRKLPELMAQWEQAAAKAKTEGRGAPSHPQPPTGPGSQNTPSGLFNGEIAGLMPFSLRGVVWYQGEQNSDRGYQYRKLLPAMIRDWRTRWGRGDFAFLIVQLPNYGDYNPALKPSPWAELREAQAMALSLPNTGMAVTIDIGEEKNIHPKDKQSVAHRLSLLARKQVYGQDVAAHGPVYKSMHWEKNAIRIEFDYANGLTTKDGGAIAGFAVAGEDQIFAAADATFENGTVLVSSKLVEKPVAVRYDWADSPRGNLYNSDGLPAAPFRTDNFPAVSKNRK